MFYIEVLTCLSDDFPVAQTMEQIAYQIPPLFRFTCYHGTQPFGDQLLSFDCYAEFHLSNAKRRIPRMYNDHVNLYSEETNAGNNVGLVVHLYRIVPHIHSALFPTLYMAKRSAIEILLESDCFR